MFDKQESREFELTPELSALEQRLRGMTPVSPGVERDRMMFAAGKAAALAEVSQPIHIAGPRWGRHRFWPAATVAMTAASLLLATMLVWQNRSLRIVQQAPEFQSAVKLVGVPIEVGPDRDIRFATRDLWVAARPGSSGYLGTRYVALTRDAGDFPAEYLFPNGDADLPENSDSEATTARRLLDEFLPARSHSRQSRS